MEGKMFQVPGWRIIRTIGKGSFGTVYEIVKEDEFGAVIHSALKVISIPETDAEIKEYRGDGYDDASITALFKSRVEDVTAEFKLMNKLKGHTNIVSFEDYSIVQHDNVPGYDVLIRMELLTSLPDYINRQFPDGEIPDKVAIELGIDICRALELCSKNHIIHRDIKPMNIFVNENRDFKLGDFGVAKTSDHTTKATKTGAYGYMAPEVYLSKPYNASVDIYSLGLAMYWMLNERRGPFMPLPPAVPKPSQNAEAMDRRMSGEPLPAPKYGSEELKRIVLKACAFDPKDRYANPTEMKEELERVLKETASLRADSAGATADGSARTDGRSGTRKSEALHENATVYAHRTEKLQTDPVEERTTSAYDTKIPQTKHLISEDATGSPFETQGKQKKPVEQPREPVPPKPVKKTDSALTGEAKKKSKRGLFIGIAAGAVAVVAVAIVLIVGRGKAAKPATASVPISTVTTTTKPTAEPTSTMTQTAAPATNPTETPEPTPTYSEPEVYLIDDYYKSQGYRESGEYLIRYADDTNKQNSAVGLKYMWKTCYFGKNGSTYNGPIVIAGKVRDNAIATVFAGKSSKRDDGINQKYDGGYVEFQNPQGEYDRFEFSLGALSQPSKWFGPADEYGYYRIKVQVDGTTQIETQWLDCYALNDYSVVITGCSTIRVYIDASIGTTGGSPNPGLFDMQFIKQP